MKTPLHSRGIAAMLLLAVLSTSAFQADAQVVQINTGAANTPLYAVGPIYMSSTLYYRYSRFAYLYTQSEMAAAGILPGAEISTVGWMKTSSSSAVGPAVFSIYMNNSSVAAYSDPTKTWASLSAGASLVYTNAAQSIPATSAPNYIDFALPTPFTYTGGSLEILTQWDISAASDPIATGSFDWVNTTVVDRIYASGDAVLPATLSSTSNNVNMDNRRPVVEFTVTNATGINELLDAQFSIWPNPAARTMNIRNESGSPVESIVMTDALGKVVLEESPSGAPVNYQIDLGKLDAGSYLVGIRTRAGRIVKRVTVL